MGECAQVTAVCKVLPFDVRVWQFWHPLEGRNQFPEDTVAIEGQVYLPSYFPFCPRMASLNKVFLLLSAKLSEETMEIRACVG